MMKAARGLKLVAAFLLASFFLPFALHADEHAQLTLRKEPLVVETSSGQHRFTVEMALSSEQRERGLMYRDKLAPDEGMIFSSGRDEIVVMWMKNTKLPLDMIFIEADGTVANIVERTRPYSLNPISSGVPVRAILELGAGTARRIALKSGDKMRSSLFGNRAEN